MNKSKVWLVTGVSSGLGKELAKAIYQAGHIIVGTVRNESDKRRFEVEFPDRSQVFLLDLRKTDQLTQLIDQIQLQFGRIDVLVNNAGYGLMGLVEEVSESELRDQFEVNVVGVWKLTQAVLPIMRRQGYGLIIQLSSRVGLAAGAGGGIYAASKFALEGLSEALSQEVSQFGINVMLVEPGPLRTDFFGRSVVFAQRRIADYYSLLTDFRQTSKRLDGKQDGDPGKVAQIIVTVASDENPPLRLPFTQATIDTMQQKILTYQQTIKIWSEQATKISVDAQDDNS
ncbi:oxidoreductase [Spirosoma flavus]